MNEKDLLRLKERIDAAKMELAKLQGQKEHLMGELKTKWSCDSIKAAEQLVAQMDRDIQRTDAQVRKGLEKCEEMMQSIGLE